MIKSGGKAALVAMERGVSWPSYIHAVAGNAACAVVETQAARETSVEFAERVRARLEEMARRELCVSVVAFAARRWCGAAETAARERMCEVAIDSITRSGGGELVLYADDTLPEEQRHELLRFVGALCGSLGNGDVSVRARFADRERPAGVRLRSAARRAPRPFADVGHDHAP